VTVFMSAIMLDNCADRQPIPLDECQASDYILPAKGGMRYTTSRNSAALTTASIRNVATIAGIVKLTFTILKDTRRLRPQMAQRISSPPSCADATMKSAPSS